MKYPDVIFATEKIGSNGIRCLDYKNKDDDVKYIRADLVKLQNKSSNSDYVKSCDDCIYGVDGCQHEPPCATGTGKPYFKKRDFA